MSETPETETPDEQEPKVSTPTPDSDKDRIPKARFDEINGKLKAANKRLAEVEAALGEGEKLKEQLATERRNRETAEMSALRLRVVVAKGLPAEVADRLKGNNEDELNTDADALIKLGFGRKQAPDIDGDRGSSTPKTYSQAQLADPKFYADNRADILRAMAEGRIKQ